MKLNFEGERKAVWSVMCDGQWRTLREIVRILDGPYSEAGVSARLRDFRKEIFGGHEVLKRKVVGSRGLYQYKVIPQKSLFGTTLRPAAPMTHAYPD